MGTTPAAQIARLKVTYGTVWRITRENGGCRAVLRADPSQFVWARRPALLEVWLLRADYHYRAGAGRLVTGGG